MSDQIPLGIDADLYRRAFGQLDGPIHWPSLTSDERAARSRELWDWVTQLVTRFDVEPRVIPTCWQRHNGMVEALSALRDHERASYADAAPPTAAVDWLRALREVELRLHDLAAKTQCTAQTHRDTLPRTWPRPSSDAGESAGP